MANTDQMPHSASDQDLQCLPRPVCPNIWGKYSMFIAACIADDVEYPNGAMWKSANDPCESCLCEEGITTCHRMDKCPVECDHGTIPRGQCCSPCTGKLFIITTVKKMQYLLMVKERI